MSEWSIDQIEEIREQVTVLKAERDEAVRIRDEIHQQLMDLLARVHGDGGDYVANHGVAMAIEDANDVIARMQIRLGRYQVLNDGNRSELARLRAGLSIGQAARLLDVDRDELLRIETARELHDPEKYANFYDVSVDWITGRVPRFDFGVITRMSGFDHLAPHDREAVAECIASIPTKKTSP